MRYGIGHGLQNRRRHGSAFVIHDTSYAAHGSISLILLDWRRRVHRLDHVGLIRIGHTMKQGQGD